MSTHTVERLQRAMANGRGRLDELEAKVEKALTNCREGADALREIRDKKLYLQAGHQSFEDYCLKRWTISRPRAYQLIEFSETVEQLEDRGIGQVSTGVDKENATQQPLPLPENERQTRQLTGLTPAKKAKVWKKAVKSAQGQPTARQVAKAREPGDDFEAEGEPGNNKHVIFASRIERSINKRLDVMFKALALEKDHVDQLRTDLQKLFERFLKMALAPERIAPDPIKKKCRDCGMSIVLARSASSNGWMTVEETAKGGKFDIIEKRITASAGGPYAAHFPRCLGKKR